MWRSAEGFSNIGSIKDQVLWLCSHSTPLPLDEDSVFSVRGEMSYSGPQHEVWPSVCVDMHSPVH